MGYTNQAPKRVIVEVMNALTHGVAALLAIVGTISLIIKGISHGSSNEVVAYSIYGVSLFLLFLTSTLYHSFSFTGIRTIFQKLDHSAIYLLIAGTYTPYLLVSIGGWQGYLFLSLIWILALAGIIFEVVSLDKFPKLSTFLYLALGWLSLFLLVPLVKAAGWTVFFLLLAGGITYSLGTIFYRMKHIDWMHVIWHLFVMGGAAFMFVSILVMV